MSDDERKPDDLTRLLRQNGVLEGLAVALGQFVNEVISTGQAHDTELDRDRGSPPSN
jgi:hypothetical protein